MAIRPVSFSKEMSTLRPVRLSTYLTRGTRAFVIQSTDPLIGMSCCLKKFANLKMSFRLCPYLARPPLINWSDTKTRSMSAVGKYKPAGKEPNVRISASP